MTGAPGKGGGGKGEAGDYIFSEKKKKISRTICWFNRKGAREGGSLEAETEALAVLPLPLGKGEGKKRAVPRTTGGRGGEKKKPRPRQPRNSASFCVPKGKEKGERGEDFGVGVTERAGGEKKKRRNATLGLQGVSIPSILLRQKGERGGKKLDAAMAKKEREPAAVLKRKGFFAIFPISGSGKGKKRGEKKKKAAGWPHAPIRGRGGKGKEGDRAAGRTHFSRSRTSCPLFHRGKKKREKGRTCAWTSHNHEKWWEKKGNAPPPPPNEAFLKTLRGKKRRGTCEPARRNCQKEKKEHRGRGEQPFATRIDLVPFGQEKGKKKKKKKKTVPWPCKIHERGGKKKKKKRNRACPNQPSLHSLYKGRKKKKRKTSVLCSPTSHRREGGGCRKRAPRGASQGVIDICPWPREKKKGKKKKGGERPRNRRPGHGGKSTAAWKGGGERNGTALIHFGLPWGWGKKKGGGWRRLQRPSYASFAQKKKKKGEKKQVALGDEGGGRGGEEKRGGGFGSGVAGPSCPERGKKKKKKKRGESTLLPACANKDGGKKVLCLQGKRGSPSSLISHPIIRGGGEGKKGKVGRGLFDT